MELPLSSYELYSSRLNHFQQFHCDKCRIYQKFLFFSSSGSNTHISQVSAHFLCKTSQSIPPRHQSETTMRADYVNLHNRYNNSFSWAPTYVISVQVATLTMEFMDIPYRNLNNCTFTPKDFSLFFKFINEHLFVSVVDALLWY